MESIQTDNETISLKKIIVNYISHWKLFVAAACFSVIPAVLYLVLYPKTYEIKAKMKIQEDKDLTSSGSMGLGEAAGLMKSFGLGGGSVAGIVLDDEIAMLSSNELLKKTAIRLGLNVTYEQPFSFIQLYEDTPLRVIPDSVTQYNLKDGFEFKIKVNSDGSAKLKIKETGENYSFESLPAQLKTPSGSFDIVCTETSKIQKPFTLNVVVSPAGWTAEDLQEIIQIEEFSKNANTLELSCTDYEKKRAVDLLNTLMEEYNKNTDAIKKDENLKMMDFLDSRVQSVMQDLNGIERTIEAYKISNKMTDMEYDVQFYTDAVKLFREKIIEMEAQGYLIDLLDDFVKDPKNKYSIIPPMLSVGEGEKGGAVSSYNEALLEREKLIKSSTTDNPLSEIANNQVDKLRQGVVQSISNMKKSYQLVLDDLKSQEKKIMDKMGNVPTYEREYLDLKRQQEILQGVYLILLQKREELALSSGHGRDKGLILDSAYVKYIPIGPRKLYAAIFMVVFTILIPVGYLFGKEQIRSLIIEYKNSKHS